MDVGLSMVPVVGQAYGLAQSAAALRDPEASTADKAMAAASVIPAGKLADKLRKIVVGEKTVKGVPAYEESLKRAKQLALKFRKAEESADPSKGARGVSDLVRGDPRINDEIAKETGWFYDPDSRKWMTELDDSRTPIDYEFLDQAAQNRMTTSLGDVMPHTELSKMPEGQKILEQVSVRQEPSLGRGGKITFDDETIQYGNLEPTPQSMRDVRDTMIHETQHDIAYREGFPTGTNVRAAGSRENYMRDPGEALARVAALRRNMTPEARRKFPFYRHMDEERARLMDPSQVRRYADEEDLKRMLKLRNLDPDEMLVRGP